MQILLTKLTDARHRFEVVRPDGSWESTELETRSLLLHDLAHYTVEAEAGLERGFYGLLESGVSLTRLNDRDASPADPQRMLPESLAAPMQTLFGGRMSRDRYLELGAAAGIELVTPAFVDGALERLRRLIGHWRATPFRGVMEVEWPPMR